MHTYYKHAKSIIIIIIIITFLFTQGMPKQLQTGFHWGPVLIEPSPPPPPPPPKNVIDEHYFPIGLFIPIISNQQFAYNYKNDFM